MADVKVVIDSTALQNREQTWKLDQPLPDEAFSSFRCKYWIQANQKFLDAQKTQHGKAGYIYVEVEQYGFDEYINIVVQERGQFITVKEGARIFENIVFG